MKNFAFKSPAQPRDRGRRAREGALTTAASDADDDEITKAAIASAAIDDVDAGEQAA